MTLLVRKKSTTHVNDFILIGIRQGFDSLYLHMISIILILFFIGTTILFGYASFVSMKKIEQYEDWTISASEKIESVVRKMNRIDESGMFKSDDDVGEIFDQLVSVVNELRVLEYDKTDSP